MYLVSKLDYTHSSNSNITSDHHTTPVFCDADNHHPLDDAAPVFGPLDHISLPTNLEISKSIKRKNLTATQNSTPLPTKKLINASHETTENSEDPSTPKRPAYQIRNHFTPNMFTAWKMVCTLCDQEIVNKKDHLMNDCPAIQGSSVKIKDTKGRPIKKRKSKRLFALGEIHDTKD